MHFFAYLYIYIISLHPYIGVPVTECIYMCMFEWAGLCMEWMCLHVHVQVCQMFRLMLLRTLGLGSLTLFGKVLVELFLNTSWLTRHD